MQLLPPLPGILTWHRRILWPNVKDLRLSIGIACYPQHGANTEALMRSADSALYRAKEQGRDQVVIAYRREKRCEAVSPGRARHSILRYRSRLCLWRSPSYPNRQQSALNARRSLQAAFFHKITGRIPTTKLPTKVPRSDALSGTLNTRWVKSAFLPDFYPECSISSRTLAFVG